jgi:hypothetical protein
MSSDSESAISDLTETQHARALVHAQAYLRTVEELYERSRRAAESSAARLLAAERTLRIAQQVVARIEMLGVQFQRN